MTTVQVNLLYTLVVALLVYFAGQLLVRRVPVLQRFSLPPAGGCLIAVIPAMADGFANTGVSFDMSLKDSLLIAFFTTVGLAADARMLVKGGSKLAIFLLVCTVFIVVQNAVGLAAAWAMDMHPVFGLFGGSVTLTGGHGTGAAYAARLGETMNLHSAMELTMAFATAGLVVGALMGGPLGVYLIQRHGLSGPAQAKAGKTKAGKAKATATAQAGQEQTVTAQSFLAALFIVLVCLAGGRLLANWMEGGGLILPDFLFALLLGVLIRNVASFTGLFRIDDRSIELIGGVSLSLFLVMALMAMKLLDLVSMAGPLLIILVLQVIAMAFYAVFVTFRVMGKDYDAAIMAAGHVGFAMSSTAAALAIMRAVTERTGVSPLAFLIVPMVGAFFIDIMNALIIQGFLALPAFGF
jgi:ESS family glutamate:Na+ symporter